MADSGTASKDTWSILKVEQATIQIDRSCDEDPILQRLEWILKSRQV